MATEESVQAEELQEAPGPSEAPTQAEAHRPLLSLDRTTASAAGAKHYLVPVDDTDDSEEAIDWAIQMFGPGSVFHLLHVVPEPQMLHLWAGTYIPPDENAELIEVEDTKLFVSHRFAKKLIAAKIPFKLHVVVGPTDSESVSNVILKKAQDVSAECIVMARHSKGRLKEMWVGSVTKACVHKSQVPVAVVPHFQQRPKAA
ncbi:adenine nucleotide alpha hydrolase [Chlorella sorokiniana]|uniref:Adenine nucleotide alpha hydrolase n=1 Tax=Chlorella sorokiniana TaxID=3076 RepID=A0A2P6TZB1_CHLSO|nr:adenine nucleotide alpha hydrolase [Chlorella sorokiniana]|eukprot:PRW59405.1 adenine nucleotide alpha hydrolase [Chlorella sorokiniana]